MEVQKAELEQRRRSGQGEQRGAQLDEKTKRRARDQLKNHFRPAPGSRLHRDQISPDDAERLQRLGEVLMGQSYKQRRSGAKEAGDGRAHFGFGIELPADNTNQVKGGELRQEDKQQQAHFNRLEDHPERDEELSHHTRAGGLSPMAVAMVLAQAAGWRVNRNQRSVDISPYQA